MLKRRKQNKAAARSGSTPAMKKLHRNIFWQAGLALLTVVLTIVIVFSMSAAWYTNVVQTSGLVIQAESWGFDGEIKVSNAVITAAPGDEGVVSLEAYNNNQSVSEVSVGVSKARMDTQMQQRLYFYVDAPMTRNNETMERVYLSSKESYTYTLFGGEDLILTEEMHSDAQIKWHWVYDVLGYYVLGTWSEERNTLSEEEYLRPIEYDYDQATTTFSENGDTLTMELKTVDGETTVEDFLVALSRTDGYQGQIDPASKLGSGYYPVDVDENGYGVYAYLCTYSDIELATEYDTALGQAAKDALENGTEPQVYETKLLICAQKNNNNAVSVSSLSSLQGLLELNSKTAVQLSDDITMTGEEKLVIPQGSSLTLDLNGHTITGTPDQKLIEAQPGSSLTLLNGQVTGSGSYGLYCAGAQVVCHQVELSGFRYGVYVGDNSNDNTVDSVVRLVDCDISASGYTVFVSGNGTASEQKTQLVVDNCRLYSDGMVLCSNGSDGRWGTDIQILNSTLTSNPDNVSAGIYHPQKDSTLTVYNSTVSGYTGIAIKGGSVSIQGSTVTGSGAKQSPQVSGSGFADTGDGIYIEANYGYDILLQISGADVTDGDTTTYRESVISSDHGYSLQVFEPDADNVTVQIYSGRFDESQNQAYLAEGSVQTESDGAYLVATQADTE